MNGGKFTVSQNVLYKVGVAVLADCPSSKFPCFPVGRVNCHIRLFILGEDRNHWGVSSKPNARRTESPGGPGSSPEWLPGAGSSQVSKVVLMKADGKVIQGITVR